MAYNFVQMRTRAAYIASQAGSMSATPQPDWKVEINNAVSVISWESEYNVETGSVTTIYGQAEYVLPFPMWRTVEMAIYQPQGQIPALPLQLITEQEMNKLDYMWVTQVAGTPIYFWITNSNTLRIYPPAAASGDLITFRGSREAQPLINDFDQVACPGAYHELHPLYAACNFWESLVQEGDVQSGKGDVGVLLRMQRKYDELLEKLTNWCNDDNAALQRTVMSRPAPRVSLGVYLSKRRRW